MFRIALWMLGATLLLVPCLCWLHYAWVPGSEAAAIAKFIVVKLSGHVWPITWATIAGEYDPRNGPGPCDPRPSDFAPVRMG